jgi:hypothetical protein
MKSPLLLVNISGEYRVNSKKDIELNKYENERLQKISLSICLLKPLAMTNPFPMRFMLKSLIKRVVVSINTYKNPKQNITISSINPGKTLNELFIYMFRGNRVIIVKYSLASPAPQVLR